MTVAASNPCGYNKGVNEMARRVGARHVAASNPCGYNKDKTPL